MENIKDLDYNLHKYILTLIFLIVSSITTYIMTKYNTDVLVIIYIISLEGLLCVGISANIDYAIEKKEIKNRAKRYKGFSYSSDLPISEINIPPNIIDEVLRVANTPPTYYECIKGKFVKNNKIMEVPNV